MKNSSLFALVTSALFISSCEGSNKAAEDTKTEIKPGTVVASAEMPVTDDSLNNFTFSVKVVADSTRGVYDIDADYGPNFAEGQFVMPKGGEDLVPLLKRGNSPNTWVIGFRVAGDTTFYDYFEVSCTKKATKMQ